jgi:hypothetical protein
MNQLNNDPEYLARVAKAESERNAVHEALSRAERPLVDELQAAGVAVTSAWHLYEHPESGEIVYPILVRHLRLDYPGRVLSGIARAFTKDVARRHWAELLEIYLSEVRAEAQDGLAATLSRCAAKVHYDDLVSTLENEALGESRIYFLRPVNRIGNRISAGAGHKVIERFADHPVLGVESNRILRGQGRND